MTTLFLLLIVVVILTCIWLNNISSQIGIPSDTVLKERDKLVILKARP